MPTETKQLRLNDRDEEIFLMFETREFVTVEDVVAKYGRNITSTRAALARLAEHGLLLRNPTYKGTHFAGFAYQVPTKSKKRIRERFDVDVRATDYAPSNITHEVLLGRLGDAFVEKTAIPQFQAFEPPFIERRRNHLQDGFKYENEHLSINPDLVLGLQPIGTTIRAFFYVELEKTLGHYRDQESQQMKKARAYFHYRNEGLAEPFWKKQNVQVKDFKTCFVFVTEQKRDNWLRRMKFKFPYKMFWGAWIDDVLRDPYGEVWISPSEFNPVEPAASPRTGVKNLLELGRH